MQYGELKHINIPSIGVRSGSFARVTSESNGGLHTDNWVYCRDSFHYHFNGVEQLVFAHSPHASKRIAAFIYEFERQMKHEKLSLCGPTNMSRITWIKPAKFWLTKSIRKSLFTCLLRAGIRYDPEKNNFEEALNSVPYLARTKSAVKWFLRGYTWPKKNEVTNDGWYDNFNKVKDTALASKLIRKPINEKKLMDYALELLGMNREELRQKFLNQPKK